MPSWGPGNFAILDLDADGKNELVTTAEKKIYALKGDGTSTLWSFDTQNIYEYNYLTYAFDIDRDGTQEILFWSGYDLSARAIYAVKVNYEREILMKSLSGLLKGRKLNLLAIFIGARNSLVLPKLSCKY